jgi:hypothetical protein
MTATKITFGPERKLTVVSEKLSINCVYDVQWGDDIWWIEVVGFEATPLEAYSQSSIEETVRSAFRERTGGRAQVDIQFSKSIAGLVPPESTSFENQPTMRSPETADRNRPKD